MIRRIGGAALALAVTAVVVGLSHAPVEVESDEGARIRLSWRFRATVEECRELSEAELAERPVHMRRPVVCERRIPPHRLRVEVDGRVAVDEVVRAAGARHDRPLYVFREIPVDPGRHRLTIRFERADADTGGSAGNAAEAVEGGADRPPGELVLETTVTLAPREVALVTYDPGAGRFRRVEPGPDAGGG